MLIPVTLPTFTDFTRVRRMQGPPHVSSTKPLQAFERFCWTSGCPRPTVRVRAVLWCGTHSAHGCVVYSTPHSWHGKHAAAARGWQLAARLYPSRVPMQIRGSRAKEVSLRALPCLRCDCLLVPHSQWPVGGEESLRGGFLAGLGIYLARACVRCLVTGSCVCLHSLSSAALLRPRVFLSVFVFE